MTTPATPYVLIEDIAKYFSVSMSTVRSWVRNGSVPKHTYIKIGQTYRFKLAEVEAALTAPAKTSEPPEQLEFDFEGDKE
jgi:excisionase family DNA binding protein